jgi:hypothetical protein
MSKLRWLAGLVMVFLLTYKSDKRFRILGKEEKP